MKIAIVIPWREQPSRVQAFKEVVDWYKTHFPHASIYLPNHPSEVWLPSHTRNDGVRMAQEDGCDVIIMNDADTIPQYKPLVRAIEGCLDDGLMHNPYTAYYALTENGTKDFMLGKDPSQCQSKLFETSCFGTVVFKTETWWEIGGMDEKFKQWGWEDTAMEHAHLIIKGSKFVKHDGSVFSVWHEPQPKKGSETFTANKALYEKRYLKTRNPSRMLELVKSKA